MKTLSDLIEKAKSSRKKRVVVVGAEDKEAVKAVFKAKEIGIVEEIFLVGNSSSISYSGEAKVIHAHTEREAAETGVKIVSSGLADVVIKGLVKTSTLLKAVLNKEWGLRGSGLLSHLAGIEVPGVERVIFITDGGMVIKPNIEQKILVIKNAVDFLRKLGYETPKVALICAVETVNNDMPETTEAAVITKMAQRGEINGCLVDGPLGLDNALCHKAAEIKGVKSPVAGQADILVVPDIHSGNFLGKSAVYFAKGKIAGLIVGANAPIVVVSRADSAESKLLSIALAISAG